LREQAELLLAHTAASLLQIESWPPRTSDGLRVHLPRHPVSVALARQAVRRWLDQFDASPSQLFDISLALSEACTNAVEHAQHPRRQAVELEARLDAAELALSVHDYGHWRDESLTVEDRGRGLDLMRSLVDSVEVASGTDGTHTHLRQRFPKPTP
jgi:anti-sigma regulatory factor (Ser/Thr protein kinase)